MATTSLPLNHLGEIPELRPAPAPPSMLEQYGQMMALRNEQQEQQVRAQQMQAGQQEMQMRTQQMQEQQMNMNSQKALMGAFSGLDPSDPNYFEKGLAKAQQSGQVMPAHLQSIMQAQKQWSLAGAQLTGEQLKNQQTLADGLYSLGQGYLKQNDDQMIQNWPTMRQKIIAAEGLDQQRAEQMVPEQFPGRDWVQNQTTALGMSAAGMRAAAAQQTAQTGQDRLAASMNPQSSLYAPTSAAVALGTAPGAQQIQQNEVTQAAAKAGAEAKARQPYELALAAQRQALSQGDPNAAAQLLVDGDATLSELKARGSTPEFISRTLHAAHQLSGGTYNAQQADAAFNVAKSPTNVAFFGSAKSLTDKGGTLDQLADAGKALPQAQMPVFNSIADWEKAATGSGPIAHYAATALGVADDYAKVMGGGQGSDTSRLAALNIIAAKQSPEQRAAAIQGIRNAVNSQTVSRIGNNKILGRMYGDIVQNGSTGNTNPNPTVTRYKIVNGQLVPQ